jgi:hypothetical protein
MPSDHFWLLVCVVILILLLLDRGRGWFGPR